jgi:hypothetical protein
MYSDNNNGYQQHQGGYQQDNRQGMANEYYSEGQGQQQHAGNQQNYNQPPPQYQQHNSQYGQHPQHQGSYSSIPSNDSHGQRDNRDLEHGGNQNNDGQGTSRGFLGAAAGAAVGGFGAYKLAGPATGHSKTSGLVGALGGALTGHVIQDGASHWKGRRDEKKEAEKRDKDEKKQHPSDRRDSNERRSEGHFAGGFTRSSRDVRLDAHGAFNLHAQCRREDGAWQGSTLALDHVLENDNGSFRWSSSGGRPAVGGPSTISVQAGDTLRAIAARHNCDFHELARHNGIQNEDMIYPAQKLEVPGAGSGGGVGGGGNFGASARNVRLVEGGQVLEGELRRGGDWVMSSIVLDERIQNKNGCLELV